MSHQIIQGDCLEVLKTYPDNHFTSVITDPPYGLSFMRKKWDYDVPSIEIWQECLRVLKPGGTMLCFAGSRTQHRMAVNIENAGFIIKDCLMYLYGTGFPKATDISKQLDKGKRETIGKMKPIGMTKSNVEQGSQNRSIYEFYKVSQEPVTPEAKLFNGYKSHGLKPAYEPIIMCMKPNDGTYANNAIEWGVSGINIDKSRIGTEVIKTNGKGNQDGNTPIFPQSPNYEGKAHSGRFPANIILDEEAGQMLDEQSGELLRPGNKKLANISAHNGFDGVAFKIKARKVNLQFGDSGGASRFFYTAKASKSERNGSKHPTMKPLALMKYLINLIMPPKDGLILDPFAGSGTTILAAKQLGYNAIGIEREKEYCEIANKRLENVSC